MRSQFCILTVLGDLLDGGEKHFLEAAQTLDAAKRRIEALAESTSGQYVIYKHGNGQRVSVIAGDEKGFSPQNECRQSSLNEFSAGNLQMQLRSSIHAPVG